MIIAYLRKSRADLELEALGEMETLYKHEQVLEKLAVQNGEYIQKYYREIVSGESIEARPEMQKVLELLYTGKVTKLYVVELERLGRGNVKDQGALFEALMYSGVKIVTPAKTYDPLDPADEEYLEFALFMSRREYKTITRRMQTAKLDSIKSGNYIGTNPPYGFDIIKPDRKTRTLKPNKDIETVKMMFNWFVNDRMTSGQIARRLNAMGIPTARDCGEWRKCTINEIIKNVSYIGKVRWFKRSSTNKNLSKRREVLICEGKHDAVIDEELFNRAQSLFNSPPLQVNKEITNVLAGLLKCAKCGKAMSRAAYKRSRPRFVHTKGMKCTVKSAAYDDIVDAVILKLKEMISDFEFKMTNEAVILQQHQKQKEIDALKKELEEQTKQRSYQFELLEQGIYTPEEFKERRAIITARMNEIEELLQNTTVEIKDYSEEIIKFSTVLDSLKNPNIPLKTKNDLLKDIISHITYKNERDKITLNIICK